MDSSASSDLLLDARPHDMMLEDLAPSASTRPHSAHQQQQQQQQPRSSFHATSAGALNLSSTPVQLSGPEPLAQRDSTGSALARRRSGGTPVDSTTASFSQAPAAAAGALSGAGPGGLISPPQFTFPNPLEQQRLAAQQAASRARTEAWLGQQAPPQTFATSALHLPGAALPSFLLQNGAAPRTSEPNAPRPPSTDAMVPGGQHQPSHSLPAAGPGPSSSTTAAAAALNQQVDPAMMAALLSNLPPEQRHMLAQLGIIDAAANAGYPAQSPPDSFTNLGAHEDAANAAVSSLEAAEALWQQAVAKGADDQALLTLAAQLGLITTDAMGQAVLTRDLLQQHLSQQQQQSQQRRAVSPIMGFAAAPGAPASGSSLGISSPTGTTATLPHLGTTSAPPQQQQQQPRSIETLLVGMQSAGMLGHLLGLVVGLGGPATRLAAGKTLGSPGPSKQHALYKTELCRGWLEVGTCRYGAKCQFAHGREELRPVPRHPKYKTEVCRSFAATGVCAYGARCRFIHGAVSAPQNAFFLPPDAAASSATATATPALAGLAGTAAGFAGGATSPLVAVGASGTTGRPSNASLLGSSAHLEGVLGFDEPHVGAPLGALAQAGPLGLRHATTATAQQQQREAARMAAMTQLMAARLLGLQHPAAALLPAGGGGGLPAVAGRMSLDSALSAGSHLLPPPDTSRASLATTGRQSASLQPLAELGTSGSESQRMSLESCTHHATLQHHHHQWHTAAAAMGGVRFGGGSGANRASLESCVSQSDAMAVGGVHPDHLLRSSGDVAPAIGSDAAREALSAAAHALTAAQYQQQQQQQALRTGLYGGAAGDPTALLQNLALRHQHQVQQVGLPGGGLWPTWEQQQQQAQVLAAYKSGLYTPLATGAAAAAVAGVVAGAGQLGWGAAVGRPLMARQPSPGVLTPEKSETGGEPSSDLLLTRR